MPISPLQYLVQIDCIELLPRLYGEVVVPAVVCAELAHPAAPEQVRQWVLRLPPWISVQSSMMGHPTTGHEAVVPPQLLTFDAGERAAILIALNAPEALLLADDAAARKVASRLGLPVVGTLGVLEAAHRAGWVNLNAAAGRLVQTGFRFDYLLRQTYGLKP